MANCLLNEEVAFNAVLDAIQNKYQVRIRYDDGQGDDAGNPKGSRVIKPFAIGTTKKVILLLERFKKVVEAVRVLQIGSSSDLIESHLGCQ